MKETFYSVTLARLLAAGKYLKVAPDWFIDCGPQREKSEALIAQKVWPNIKIIGLEPCDENYNQLKAKYPGDLLNLAADETGGISTGFVGGRRGFFKFGCEEDEGYSVPKQVAVSSITLDSLFAKKPDGTIFIWADIEGGELRMLKGATGLLKSGRLVGLSLELCPKHPVKIWPNYTGCRPSCDEIIEFLDGFGFSLFDFDPNLWGDWESKGWYDDFIFVKKS